VVVCKEALTQYTTYDTMEIRLAYDRAVPLVSSGTSHVQDDAISICSRPAEMIRR
jgi:hypothetical protein